MYISTIIIGLAAIGMSMENYSKSNTKAGRFWVAIFIICTILTNYLMLRHLN